jgi:hypothetical protein
MMMRMPREWAASNSLSDVVEVSDVVTIVS